MGKPEKNKLEKNKGYLAQIIDYTTEGAGVARVQGCTVFVPETAVGDICEIKILRVTSKLSYGKLIKIRTPSPARIKAKCQFSSKCGGCCFQHISYEEELRAKLKRVKDALSRIGGQDVNCIDGIVGADKTEGYRNKAQYPVGRDANGRLVCGFYRPHSHEIVPISHCLLQNPKADRLMHTVCDWMERYEIPPYDSSTGRGSIRHIYARIGEKSGECQLTLISATDKIPQLDELVTRLREAEPSLTGILINHNQRPDNVIMGDKTDVLWGEPLLEDRLCGNSFLLAPEAFYQVNHAQAEKLYEYAIDCAGLCGDEQVVELYCGAGTITLSLAKHAKKVIGIEIVPEAIENARQNAARNGITNVEFICADAGQAARRLIAAGASPDVVVVDPPRKGLDEQARDAILCINPARIVYVSCDPATLARDVRELCMGGYRLERGRAFDLFPRTGHVEVAIKMTYCGK